MRLTVHLTFPGTCGDAFRFYERTLGGKNLQLFRYGDSPAAASVPPEWRDKMVHAGVDIGDLTLLGADAAGDAYRAPQGFFVFLRCADAAQAERVFAALADGGRVDMPLQQTFWSPCFGVLVDRYGIPWEVTTE